MPESHRVVYVCEVCFAVSATPLVHHDRPMIECDAGCPGDDCTKPITDEAGHLLTRAPKWWVHRHRRAGAASVS
jgi:hypothetical protein